MIYVVVTFVAFSIVAGFIRLRRDERARSNRHSVLDAWHADESMLRE
jgi:hypothetical protein